MLVEALPGAFWLMAALAAIADTHPFTPRGRQWLGPTAYPSVCFGFAILLAYGLGSAVAVQAVAVMAGALRTRPTPRRLVLLAGEYAIAYATAEVVLRVGGLRPYPSDGRLVFSEAAVVVLAAGAWLASRYATAVVAWPGSGWRGRPRFTWDGLTHGALLLLGPILVSGAAAAPMLVPLALVPLYAVNRLARVTEEYTWLQRRDPLTSLANRRALVAAMAGWIARRPKRGPRLALLLLDLDRFQNINDALGHDVGDRLLVEIARRLRTAAGPGCLVARLGGDEFAICVPDVSGTADACAVASRVNTALLEPVHLDGLPLYVSAAIGVAVCPDHGDDVDSLLRHADVAMYDAKQRAAAVAVYTAESDHHSPERLTLLADLREALRDPGGAGVTMHYQPQVALATGEVIGVEALLRWQHPERGPIRPDQLIKLAEHTAVMRLLTLRIIDEVVEQVAKWSAAGLTLRASVNVSLRELQTGEVADRLAHQLRRYDVPASLIQLEITEGALMADPRRVLATVAALDRLGVAISLDDFGTGYSSLQHLRRLPLSEVKVDRSFVLGMARDPDDAAIVTSIIELADALGLRVVAEGVEEERTWRQLAAAGCHAAQGWFYARPMPADDLVTWLARYRPMPAPGAGAARRRPRSGAGA